MKWLAHPWLTIRVQIALGVIFVAAAINLARGNAIDCGCFNVSAANKTTEERLADMRWDILRDLGMLLMVGQLWWTSHQLKDDDVARASDRPATVS